MIKLLVIGHLAKNVTVCPAGKGEYWGGAGYVVSWVANEYFLTNGKPDFQVALAGRCGKDFPLEKLFSSGINIAMVEKCDNKNSDKFLITEDKGKRTFSSCGNLSPSFVLKIFSPECENADWIHLATAPPEQQLCWLRQIKKTFKYPVKISCDSFEIFVKNKTEEVAEVFNNSSLIFVNEEEFEAIKDKLDKKIPIVLKRGSKGISFLENHNEVFSVIPSMEVSVIDTTHAGEVVAGIFLSGIILKRQIKDVLQEACNFATISVSDFGVEHIFKSNNQQKI